MKELQEKPEKSVWGNPKHRIILDMRFQSHKELWNKTPSKHKNIISVQHKMIHGGNCTRSSKRCFISEEAYNFYKQ